MRYFDHVKKALINRALIQNNFNQSLTARELGISRLTVQKFMDTSLKNQHEADTAEAKVLVKEKLLSKFPIEG